MQPWRFEARADVIRAWVDPTRSSLLDFRNRAALLALGAALEAAKIGARALGFEPVCRPVSADGPVWELALERWGRARDEEAVRVLWQRCCNRRTGSSRPIPEAELARLARRGAPLDTRVVAGAALAELGAALGALDRVRFLSPRLRRDLMGELRFSAPGGAGIARRDRVASLELDGADLAAMDVLRTGAGMDFLARLDRGRGLRQRVARRVRGIGRRHRPARGGRRPRRARGRRPRAHAPVARGDAPPAGHPSVGLAVPLPAPARGRRLAGGVGAHRAHRRGRRVRARRRPRAASARSCSSCACREATRRRCGRCAGRSTRCSPSRREAQYSEEEWLSLPIRLPAAEMTYHVPRKPSPLIWPGRTSAVSV